MQESLYQSENDIVKNIKESANYKSFLKEHLKPKIEREKKAKELLLENKGNYTEEILNKIFDTVDPTRRWLGSTLAKVNLKFIFKHSKSEINHWIDVLLFSNEELYDRLNKCLTEFKIKGADKGLSTLFLYLLEPDKHNIWNNATEAGLKKMGMLVEFGGNDRAQNYLNFNKAAIKFRNNYELVPQEIDTFLSLISKSEKGGQVPANNSAYKKLFLEIMEKYRLAKTNENIRKQIRVTFKSLQRKFEDFLKLADNENLIVRFSIGMGQMANVPWIAFLNPKITTTTQKGVYCVYLFKADMSGVYLTFNQGVGKTEKRGPSKESVEQVHSRALTLRQSYGWLEKYGIQLNDEINLADQGQTGMAYEKSTIAYKYYGKDEFPSDNEINKDLNYFLEAFEDYAKRIEGSQIRSWIFQGNPKYYDIEGSLQALPRQKWSVRQHKKDIKAGDTVYTWKAGTDAGILAIGTVLTDPAEIPEDEEAKEFVISVGEFKDIETRVIVNIDKVLDEPIQKDTLTNHPILSQLSILKSPQGTNFLLTPEEAVALRELVMKS